MEQMTKKPNALLFGGGGAKGAFQIGAWQALAEAGIASGMTAVAGCSVGALNAALFAIGDPAYAKRIWEQIQPSDLLARSSDGAFFSREGLIRMINQLPLEQVSASSISTYVSVHDTAENQPVFFKLNGLSADAIRTLLLASSAIPHIYAPERYLGREFMDGSMTPEGDLCVQPIYAEGYRNMLLVSMRPQLSLYGNSSNSGINLIENYPDCDFTLIKPTKPMGNLLTGTLNFAQNKIQANLEQGYADAKAVLSGHGTSELTQDEISALLVQKMRRLFLNSAQLSGFLTEYGTRFAPNVQLPTMGGNFFYDNIFEIDGWRLQQQRTPGMQIHYRILDANNIRVAWVMQPQLLLDALTDYESVLELRKH